MQSNELAEGYTLTPVTIFRVAGWGESKFSLLTTMPILVSIFLISIQKIAYILENGGWGGGAGYHVAREYSLSGSVCVGGGGIAQP